MSSRSFCCGALIASGALAWFAVAAPAPSTPQEAAPAVALYRRLDFKGIDDPKTTLQDLLDHLSGLYGVQFEVNEKAFRFEMVDDVLKKEVATPPIPPMKNARLDVLLQKLLGRIGIQSGATFLVRDEAIEITTGLFREAEVWGGGSVTKLPLVHRKFDKAPLSDVLKELSDLTEFTILLDPRAADKAKTPITARFMNTPLDTAIRFLADMSDLQSMQRDNVLYVTSKENAAAWETRLQKERKSGLEALSPDQAIEGARSPRIGTGRGPIAIVNPMGV
jgi:hypothetical protein